MQHGLFGHITEVHIVHGDVAFQLRVGDGAVSLMGMLPRPAAGAFGALHQIAIFILFGIDQRDIAVILLGSLIHQVENPLRTGQRHNDGVDLVGNLGDGHIERAGERQKGYQLAQCQQAAAGGNGQIAAHNGQNGILQIPQIVVYGPHDVGVGSGTKCIPAELFVDFIKLLLTGTFVAEYLHNTLTVDHFFHIAVDRAQRALLADEKNGGFAGDDLGDKDNG